MGSDRAPLTVLIWGTFDLGKPRMRIILAALKAAGIRVELQHIPIWDGIEDKGALKGRLVPLRFGLRYLWAILRLWAMAFRAPSHDVVLIGYLGQFDVLAYQPIALLRRKPLVWDAFLSLYDTVVIDRGKLREGGLPARSLRRLERIGAQCADRVVLDTAPHAARFATLLDVPEGRIDWVPVGAEPQIFPALPPKRSSGVPLTILFYGQFIPLHGIETIIAAARLAQAQGAPWRWRLIGTGQEAARIRKDLDASPVPGLDWVEWVPYSDLSAEIAAADVCLGIFGASGKAASVVPNKVYQVLASGRPLITRDSPAMRALAPEPVTGLTLIPASDPHALVAAVKQSTNQAPDFEALRESFGAASLSDRWYEILDTARR